MKQAETRKRLKAFDETLGGLNKANSYLVSGRARQTVEDATRAQRLLVMGMRNTCLPILRIDRNGAAYPGNELWD